MPLPLKSCHSFESIEQMDEAMRSMGWEAEYRQLDPGSFSSSFTFLEGDSWYLFEEQPNRRLEAQAPSPEGMYALGLLEGDPGTVNGQALTKDHIFLQCPGSEFRVTLPAGMKATQILVSEDQFEEAVLAVAPGLRIPRTSVNTLAVAPGRLEHIRRDMRSSLFSPSGRKATREEAVSRILVDFITVMAEHGKERFGRSLHRAASLRALNRAMEYIEAHLGRTIRISTLCRFAGTSLSTLERSFTRELGVTPQQYIKVRRLNSVYRRLLANDRERVLNITEVALSQGITHMGRFSGEYHRHFGEYPRETLKRQ